MDDHHAECVRLCRECHEICLQTATHLSTSHPRLEVSQIRLLFSCAELCQMSAGLLQGGAHPVGRAAVACADLCDRCARLCDELDDDPAVRACAQACRHCAEACRSLAALAA